MSTEDNKALVRRLFEETWNKGNLEVGDELLSSDCVLHYQGAMIPVSGETGKRIVATWRTAFPDFQFLFEDLIRVHAWLVVFIMHRQSCPML